MKACEWDGTVWRFRMNAGTPKIQRYAGQAGGVRDVSEERHVVGVGEKTGEVVETQEGQN